MPSRANTAGQVTSPRQGSALSGLMRNVLSNWGAYFVAMAINFFLSPYVVTHLGNVSYGVWTLILSLTGYLGLLDLGVRGAVTRYIAKFHTQSNHEKANEVASSAIIIFGTAGLIAILVSLVFAAFVIGRMHVPVQLLPAAKIVLALTGVSIAISLVNGVFGGILVGLQRFDLTNAIEVGINALRALTIVLALHFGSGIVGLAYIQLSFTLCRWLANILLARHLYPALRIRLSAASISGLKLIFSFSVFSFLMHVSASLINASDNVVIGAYLPVTAVTFYVIGGNLVEYARVLVSGITQTLTPLASSIDARNDPSQLRELVLFASQSAAMVILPITCTFLLRGGSFIGLWMGSQYAGPSGQILKVLSLTMIVWAGNSATGGILLGLSKHKPIVPALFTEGICNLALSIFLVKRMGIVGVAWGTVIPSVADNLIFWPWYVRRALGVRPLTYVNSALIRPWTSLIPFLLATYGIERFWPAWNLAIFFFQVMLALPFACVGYWFVCLNSGQRWALRRKIAQYLGRPLEDASGRWIQTVSAKAPSGEN
ncbi:MAG TPA: oligosaccharide flippase family protein [Terriglobales bacterium]|nr:oligosaccharide flippase family protein [Terriglobales bacterium]